MPLRDGRRDEVIEELAQQLESAYEEALAQDASEQEALRRSLAQFQNWENLRSEVFHSVEGTRLPVWEQTGVFAPRRWLVWTALGMSVLLFTLPAFRQALEIVPLPGTYPALPSLQIFSDKALRRIEQSGDQQKYARALAFVASHSEQRDSLRAMHAAEQAIALDPQLTWISAKVIQSSYFAAVDAHPWIERLQAWDPQNGFVYLLEADANVHYWEEPWAKYSSATNSGLRPVLAAEPRWRIPMEKAFAAPRLDFYDAQQFALDREVLLEQGLDRPAMLMTASCSHPVPSFMTISFYEHMQLDDIGDPAEKAGRIDEALVAYWSVVHFADRLPASPSDLMQFISNRLHQAAYNRILPLLRSKGRADEAAAVESALVAIPSRPSRYLHPADSSLEANATRSARVILISAVFVAVLGFATALWLVFVIALKWKVRVGSLSRLLNLLAAPLGIAPPALLLA